MRAPKRHRPLRRERNVPSGTDLASVAKKVIYVGSPEHKRSPSFAGAARPRADASKCPDALAGQLKKVLQWLRSAVEAGSVGGRWEQGFPRYVWFKENETIVYEARLTNAAKGEYKGYPLVADEFPSFLR